MATIDHAMKVEGLDRSQEYSSTASCQEYPHPGPYHHFLGAQDSSNWQYPGTSWPGSPYSDSNLSSSASGGVYQDGAWNPFDQSFQNSTGSGSFNSGNTYLPGIYQPGFNNPQGVATSYVTLSAITESRIRDTFSDDDESQPSSYNMRSPSDSQYRQPAWGRCKSPHRNSTSGGTSNHSAKRRKSSSSSMSPPEMGHRLRSTTTNASAHRPSTSSSSLSSLSSVSSVSVTKGARTNHNQVEKQYRNRLNGQFETLLQTLPREDGGYTGEKRVSKAEVLVLAKKHIMELERERRALEAENMDLENSVEELKRRWVGLGGICMP